MRLHIQEGRSIMNIFEFTDTVAVADVINSEGYMYPEKVLKKVARYCQETGSIVGKIGMPRDAAIPIGDVSHLATKVVYEDGKLIATIRPISTPAGEALSKMLSQNKENYTLRMAGIAQFKKTNESVVEDFRLTGIHVVLQSEAVAYPTP